MESEKKQEKSSCNCVRECPCFPKCDEMMEKRAMPPIWGSPQAGLSAPPIWNGMQPMWYGMQPASNWMQIQGQQDWNGEDEQDWEKLKEQYPKTAKMILSSVEDICDKMEYEGSAMFDVVPDKNRVKDLAMQIQTMLEEKWTAEQEEESGDFYTMSQPPCRNCHPQPNFLGDFIETMLYQEMHRRRCRNRQCRRW